LSVRAILPGAAFGFGRRGIQFGGLVASAAKSILLHKRSPADGWGGRTLRCQVGPDPASGPMPAHGCLSTLLGPTAPPEKRVLLANRWSRAARVAASHPICRSRSAHCQARRAQKSTQATGRPPALPAPNIGDFPPPGCGSSSNGTRRAELQRSLASAGKPALTSRSLQRSQVGQWRLDWLLTHASQGVSALRLCRIRLGELRRRAGSWMNPRCSSFSNRLRAAHVLELAAATAPVPQLRQLTN